MRCKNCGFENEDGRYICQNCGSPLYDENDEISEGEYDFDNDYPEDDDSSEDDAKKKQTITIVIAVIIVIAVAAGVIFGSAAGKKNKETTTESTTISTTAEEKTTKKTTTTTEKESTTKETTAEESTTKETTTESTTAERTFHVYIDIDGNGTVTGDGEYKKGDRAVLNAFADAGFEFEGWFDDKGNLTASGAKYTVTVKDDITLTARFKAVDGGDQ